MTRTAHLKEKNKALEEDSKDLQAIVERLRKTSDSDAAAVLARLRIGHSIASIIKETQDTVLSPELISKSTSSSAELDIATSVPGQVQSARILNRYDWNSSAYRRGGTPYPQNGNIHGSHNQPHYPYPISATIRSAHQVAITPPASPHTTPRELPLMMAFHEYDTRETVHLQNFGNMDFSSGILANGWPEEIQKQQISNLFAPRWLKMTVPTIVPEGHAFKLMNDSLVETFVRFRQMLADGTPLLEIAGSHPHLAAIMDDDKYAQAPPLTQWACRMVYSIKETNRLFVCYASLYLFWWIMRWMISPTAETYLAIPEFLRPSPTQLFVPHVLPLEFLAWPGLRDHLVQTRYKAEQGEWMYDMSINIGCSCPLSQEKMMRFSPEDGELELSPEALSYASNVDNWSVTPSFRQYFLDADRWMKIRWD